MRRVNRVGCYVAFVPDCDDDIKLLAELAKRIKAADGEIQTEEQFQREMKKFIEQDYGSVMAPFPVGTLTIWV